MNATKEPDPAPSADVLLDEELEEEQEDDESSEIFIDPEELDDMAAVLDGGLPVLPLEPDPAALPLPVPVGRRGSQDSLTLYMREISKFPLLTPEEEYALARKVIDENDPDAAFRLVSSHLRLVVKIAMDFQRRWMQNVLDLVQEGNVGLMRAVHKFDPE
jgi:RNA polymerase sigma-32 factor